MREEKIFCDVIRWCFFIKNSEEVFQERFNLYKLMLEDLSKVVFFFIGKIKICVNVIKKKLRGSYLEIIVCVVFNKVVVKWILYRKVFIV